MNTTVVIHILNSCGALTAILFTLFIIQKKEKQPNDFLLMGINLFSVGIFISDSFIQIELTTVVFLMTTLLPFYIFPTIFLFAYSRLRNLEQLPTWWYYTYLLAFVFTVYLCAEHLIFNNYSLETRQELYRTGPLLYHFFYKTNLILFIGSLVWILREIKKYSHTIQDHYSFIEPIQLSWLHHYCWAYIVSVFFALSFFLLYNFELVHVKIETINFTINFLLASTMLYFSYHGIRHYTLAEYYNYHSSTLSIEETVQIQPQNVKKYQTSSLSTEQSHLLAQKLKALFEEKKVYLEPKLQLRDVAEYLNTTVNYLSQTINTIEQKNYFDFVNDYRVEHLKTLLLDPSQKSFTILALGLDSGFNSKASMNRIFKEKTGLTPSAFRKEKSQEA